MSKIVSRDECRKIVSNIIYFSNYDDWLILFQSGTQDKKKEELIDELYNSLPDLRPDTTLEKVAEALNNCRRYSYVDTYGDLYKETLELVDDPMGEYMDVDDILDSLALADNNGTIEIPGVLKGA